MISGANVVCIDLQLKRAKANGALLWSNGFLPSTGDSATPSQYIYLYNVIFSYRIGMMNRTNLLLILALIGGIAFHGSSIFFTLETSYDALIHLFFADHYANSWFEPWDYRWYTGFTVHSYPPLVHQCIALLSYLGGLKFGNVHSGLIGHHIIYHRCLSVCPAYDRT